MSPFEWDDAKSEWNLRERGFDFEFAARVFGGQHAIWRSSQEHGESRFVAAGQIEGRLFVVVFTYRRPGRIRIISARRASAKEARQYQEFVEEQAGS